MTPAKQVIFKEFSKDFSPHGWDSPSQPKVTPRKGHSLAEGASPLEKVPRTPQRQGGQPPRFLQNSWPRLADPSLESTSCPAALVSSTAQTRSVCLTPSRSSAQAPPRTAASGLQRQAASEGTSPSQKHQLPRGSGAPQAEKLPQPWSNKVVKTPERPENAALTFPKKAITSPSRGISKKSSLGEFPMASPSSGQVGWQEVQKSPSITTPPSCSAPLTPPSASQVAPSDLWPPPPPSKHGKRHKKTSGTERDFLEGQPDSLAALRVAITDNPAAITDAGKNQKAATLSSPASPELPPYPGTGFGSDWHTSSPLLIATDSDCLTLLDEAEHHGHDNLKSSISPLDEGEGLRTGTCEKQSPCDPGIPPTSPSSESRSPLMPPYDPHCMADTKQRQAATQLENQQASTWPCRAPASSQAYEVELEMQASGLPKLRIKKIDSSSLSEAEPPPREESSLLGPSVPKASKSSGKPEATCLSAPCLRPSHSTPGKSGGQTYICQSCTPTRCPCGTPSPFQTEVGVPWTPSPKHSGKTTPDTIKDWPRRKRAVDCSLGPSAGRSEVSADLPGRLSPLESEGKERGLELGIGRPPILGDFELEGVCQLPDQSPPRDSTPKAEEASWGQFGLGSRKRCLSAKEGAERQVKRACDPQGDSEEQSPGTSIRQLPSAADDEASVPGEFAVSSCVGMAAPRGRGRKARASLSGPWAALTMPSLQVPPRLPAVPCGAASLPAGCRR